MNVPPPVPASASVISNPILGDALSRAQALAIGKPTSKRPSVDSFDEAPDKKKPFQQPFAMEGSMPMSADQVMVPDNMVGLIIGRGGEQITRLQVESGCKIQMSQDGQGLPHRICTLTGSAEAISVARNMIEAIIANEGNKSTRGIGSGAMMGMGVGGGTSYEMMVPGRLVARIIGKGGEVIKALQEETGAKIVIIQDTREFADEKPLKITGPPDVVEFAKQRVDQVIAEEEEKVGRSGFRGGHGAFRGGRGGGWPNQGSYGHDSGYDVTDTMTVPSNKVGIVMGKGGETIRMICSESGAHCQVDKSGPDGSREKTIVIKGRPEAVERAKDMINDKVGGVGAYDRGHRGGNGYIHQDQSYPSLGGAPTTQPDYSAQWAEYYRSLGMVKEAEIIEQQSQARAVTIQSTQPSDYSAQWAEYYRSVGKVKEAEAIEEQMRNKIIAPQPQIGAPGQPQFNTSLYGQHQYY